MSATTIASGPARLTHETSAMWRARSRAGAFRDVQRIQIALAGITMRPTGWESAATAPAIPAASQRPRLRNHRFRTRKKASIDIGKIAYEKICPGANDA